MPPRRKLNHNYRPDKLGAKCSECPLKGAPPVPPQGQANSRLAIVGDRPGLMEHLQGLSFTADRAGVVKKALNSHDLTTHDAYLTNAVKCFNTTRKPLTEADEHKAIVCCKPVLDAELQGRRSILACGDYAMKATIGKKNPKRWRGDRYRHDSGAYVIPTFEPWHIVHKKQALYPVFNIDMGRAIKDPRRDFRWPQIIIHEGRAMKRELRRILREKPRIVGIDVETQGIDPIFAKLMCVGVSDGRVAISIPWETYRNNKYGEVPGCQDPEIRELYLAILADPDIKLSMHNGQHDMLSFKARGYEVEGFDFDTLLQHAAIAPQLPHDLEFCMTSIFPAEKWKSRFSGDTELKGSEKFTARNPKTLRVYNAKDCAAGHNLAVVQEWLVAEGYRTQENYDQLMLLQDLAMRMRKVGVTMDFPKRAEIRSALEGKIVKARAAFFEAVGGQKMRYGAPKTVVHDPWLRGLTGKKRAAAAESSPTPKIGDRYHIATPCKPYPNLGANGQHDDLKTLFFEDWGLPVTEYTEKGAPKLGKNSLAMYRGSSDEQVRAAADAIHKYREYTKLLATYVNGIDVGEDGCVHPTWKIYGTVTGRWSSSDPNAQNIPKGLMRSLFKARPGNVLVAVDYSQLELGIIGILAGDQKILEWYRAGKSIHLENARDIFEDPTITKKDPRYKLAKNVVYGLNYGAGAEKIHETVSIESPDITLADVVEVIERWFSGHPELAVWQERWLRDAALVGHVEEVLSGRREVFHLGKVEPTKALNFPIQGMAGQLVNRAILALDAELGPDERILFQVHDEIVCEGPDKDILRAKMERAMTQVVELNNIALTFRTDADWGYNWGDMEAFE